MPTYQMLDGYEPVPNSWDGYAHTRQFVRVSGGFQIKAPRGLIGVVVGFRDSAPDRSEYIEPNPVLEIEVGVYFFGGKFYRTVANGVFVSETATYSPDDVFTFALVAGVPHVLIDDGGPKASYYGHELPGRVLYAGEYVIDGARWLRAYLYGAEDYLIGGDKVAISSNIGSGEARFGAIHAFGSEDIYSAGAARFPGPYASGHGGSPSYFLERFENLEDLLSGSDVELGDLPLLFPELLSPGTSAGFAVLGRPSATGYESDYAEGVATFPRMVTEGFGGFDTGVPGYSTALAYLGYPYAVGFGERLVASTGEARFPPLAAQGWELSGGQATVTFLVPVAFGSGALVPVNFIHAVLPPFIVTLTRPSYSQDDADAALFEDDIAAGMGGTSKARMAFTPLVDAVQVHRALERMAITAAVVDQQLARDTVAETLLHEELVAFAVLEIVHDAFQTTATPTVAVETLSRVLERLSAGATPLGQVSTALAVHDAISFLEDASAALFGDDLNQATFTASLDETRRVADEFFAEVLLALSAETTRRVVFATVDTAAFSSAVDEQQRVAALVREGVLVGGLVALTDDTYTFAINTKSSGLSEYTNFPFNSFAGFGQTYLAAADDGLYELAGDTDDGANIAAAIRTGLLDFGSSLSKRMPRAYLGYTSTGNLVLKVVHSDQGVLREDWYELTTTQGAPDTRRFKLGRGPKARYWQFELVNANGADFDVDTLRLYPLILERRI